MRAVLRAALWLAALGGCGGQIETNAILLRPQMPPVRNVEIYVQGQATQRSFYEVGIVQAEGFGADMNAEELVKSLSRRGGELGCEALLRVQIDVGYARAHAAGVCVRYLDAAPAARAPAP